MSAEIGFIVALRCCANPAATSPNGTRPLKQAAGHLQTINAASEQTDNERGDAKAVPDNAGQPPKMLR